MVKPENSGRSSEHSARQLHDLDYMTALLEPCRQKCLPTCINPGTTCSLSAHTPLPGFGIPQISSLNTEQKTEAHGLLRYPPSCFQTLHPLPKSIAEYQHSVQPPRPGGFSMQSAKFGSFQNGFLIFDQSGNQMSVMYSPIGPGVYFSPTVIAKHCPYLHKDEPAARDIESASYLFHDESNENRVDGEESEMHEDTEEINALLYSDDEYDCGSDDEVTSTGHSPVVIKENNEQEQIQKEEVTNSDGPNKRQRMLDGGYMKSSLMNTVSSVKVDGFHECYVEAESSFGFSQTEGYRIDSRLDNKHSRKDKIQETMSVLESIIPGAKGKDPFLVFDEAIDYLKSLKQKARALGVSYF